jgi:hypothetical protein
MTFTRSAPECPGPSGGRCAGSLPEQERASSARRPTGAAHGTLRPRPRSSTCRRDRKQPRDHAGPHEASLRGPAWVRSGSRNGLVTVPTWAGSGLAGRWTLRGLLTVASWTFEGRCGRRSGLLTTSSAIGQFEVSSRSSVRRSMVSARSGRRPMKATDRVGPRDVS